MGMDYTDEVRRAQNQQSPTGLIFEAAGVNLVTRTAIPTAVWTYYPTLGATNNYSYGLYVNDKWSLDQHWNFQLGLRWDKYEAKNEKNVNTAGATGWSPRLGATYDLFSDSKHIFKASYARYNAKVLETVTGAVSGVGNPKEIDYYANTFWNAGGSWDPANRMTFAQLQNLSNYAIGNNTIPVAGYNDPTFNVRLNSGLKAPTVDEYQASYAYSFDWANIGSGYVKVTGTYKNWKNLVDVTVGTHGTVTDAAGNVAYINVWDNNPDAKRTYRDLVLEGQFKRNGWTTGGNITWSSLKGNYEGEGTYTPGSGQGINSWYIPGTSTFDRGMIHPYGYLTGHDPIRMRFTAAKAYENAYGKTTLGYIYRFDAGSHFSIARSISRGQLDPTLPSQSPSTYSQYYNDQWGAGVFPAQAYLDMSITQDFPLFKVGGRTVWAFGKVVIQNVFNHQQQIGFNTTYLKATGSWPNATASPWVQASTYGTAKSSSYYGQPRTIVASAGIRF
jgi:hypothetical protein